MEKEQLTRIDQRLDKIERLLLSQKTALTFMELVEYTGYSKSYLYKLSMNNDIPGGYKPTGKQWFYDRKEIDKWLLSDKVQFDEE